MATILVFRAAGLVEIVVAERKFSSLKSRLRDAPNDLQIMRQVQRTSRFIQLFRFYDVAREFAHLVFCDQGDRNGPLQVNANGGALGILEAASRDAFDAGIKFIGFNISLLREQSLNPLVTPALCFGVNYFILCNIHFVMRS